MIISASGHLVQEKNQSLSIVPFSILFERKQITIKHLFIVPLFPS